MDFKYVMHILIHLFFKMSIQITGNAVIPNLHMRKNKVYRMVVSGPCLFLPIDGCTYRGSQQIPFLLQNAYCKVPDIGPQLVFSPYAPPSLVLSKEPEDKHIEHFKTC